MGEALLTRVEADGGDSLAGLQQGDGNVNGGRARSPFSLPTTTTLADLFGPLLD